MSVTRNYMSKSLKTGLKINLVYISKPLYIIIRLYVYVYTRCKPS